jgi:cyclase
MSAVRFVARLDVKGPALVKTVHLEGLRVVGDPEQYAARYYRDGIDELLYMDIVASLYGRNHLADVLSRAVREVFVPITVGGGIRSIDDARALLRAGADKVAVNTSAIQRPALVTELARRFGAQCVVLSIEAKQRDGSWEAYANGGREPTGLDVPEWARRAEALGAGEILVTSIDREGTRTGFDLKLLAAVTTAVGVPVIASGGLGSPDDLVEAVQVGGASAVAMADAFHFNRLTLGALRARAQAAGIAVRPT